MKKHDLKKNGGAFLSGVAVLGAANILTKVLGLVFKIPLTGMLGDEGMGYFGAAYQIYTWLYMISTAGLPVALSLMISEYDALGKRDCSEKLMRTVLPVFGGIGLVGSLAMFFFPDTISSLIAAEKTYACIVAVAPALFFVCVSSAIRGYFQGKRNMTPTAVSEVMEALFKLVLGMTFGSYSIRKGYPVHITAAFAISGVTAGIFCGAVYLSIRYLFARMSDRRRSHASGKFQCDPETVIPEDAEFQCSPESGIPKDAEFQCGSESDSAQSSKFKSDYEKAVSKERGFRCDSETEISQSIEFQRDPKTGILQSTQFQCNPETGISQSADFRRAPETRILSNASIGGKERNAAVLNKNRRFVSQNNATDASAGRIFASFLAIALPVMLSSSLLSMSSMLDTLIVIRRLRHFGLSGDTALALYGNYTAYCVTLFNLPPVLIYPIVSALIPAISSYRAKNDLVRASETANGSLRLASVIAIPSALGLSVMSLPILRLIFSGTESTLMAAPLLSALAPSVFLIGIMAVTNGLLSAYRLQFYSVISMLAGGIVKGIAVYFLVGAKVGRTRLMMYASPVSTFLFYLTVTVLDLYFISRHTGLKISVRKTVAKPFAASVVCVSCAAVMYRGSTNVISSDRVCTLASLFTAVVVYGVCLLMFGVTKDIGSRKVGSNIKKSSDGARQELTVKNK